MFFNILGKVEPRPLACAARHRQWAVPDAGSPGNTCGSVPDHALPRAAARCGARHRGGGNLRRPLAGALSRGRVDGCIRLRRPTSRGADELVGHRRTTAARSTMSKTKAHGRLPEGVVLDPPSPVRVQCSVY